MDNQTVLQDLLQLNLHNFEEEVKNIVDKAVKETSMEKVLKELAVTWASMEFEHDKHPRTGVTIIRASEEVVETLEDNQVGWGFVIIMHFLREVLPYSASPELKKVVLPVR